MITELILFFYFKGGVSLHSQPKVSILNFLIRLVLKKSTIRKVLRTLILHINNSKKLLTNQ